MFSNPSYISIGDEYDKSKQLQPDRCKGVQMKVGTSKRGNAPDALFDKKFKSLSEGDKYIDPGVIEKREVVESRKRLVTDQGFKFSTPGSRSAGLGNYYGCFTKNWSHETDFVVTKKGELPSKPPGGNRNMVTNPPKRGTYGVPGTTLSRGDEYKYISDPFDYDKRAAQGETVKSDKSADKTGVPFKAASRRLDYFDSQPNVAASKIYSLDKPLPAKKADVAPAQHVVSVPFKPSSPPKRGYNACITKYEYREDPFELREKKAREDRQKNKPSVVWKPVGASKSLPVRSIAFNASAADASV
jgi:hypothetical protein